MKSTHLSVFMKLFLLAGLFGGSLVIGGCAGIRTMDISSYEILDVSRDAQRLAELEKMGYEEIMERPLVLKVPANYNLPVRLVLSSPVVSLVVDDSALAFHKSLYVYLSKEEALLSPDGQRWASFDETDDLKELFDVKKAEVKMGMSVTIDKGPVLEAGFRLHPGK